MTTDITKLAQRMKAAAVRAKTATEEYASGHMSFSVCFAECEEFNRLTDGPDNIIALVDALEKAQGMEAYWKTQCRGITDHCEELQARIAELESRTVKLPESFKLAKSSSGLRYYYADEVDAALTAAGIKVEDE
ncbi:TPA: hypothetical protein PCG32_002465 [Klebsiella pneumoniae]|nr:hypothetical protein [Klebsiella pneumoniae]HDE2211994.1 hypothetical protein [Klebsiella pneumoniae]HDE2223159.1 hypothetical protein [Klebsiella pneumoniae]HDE2249688.1 hypothetical protein [Klebsiella pneumoniae]